MAEWEDKWNDTKEDFKDATGKGKPDAKDAYGKVRAAFTTHKTNVAKTLKSVDTKFIAYRDIGTKYGSRKASETDVTDCLNEFGFAVKDFIKAKTQYGTIIEAVIAKELKDDGKTVYYRACKAMVKQLDFMETQITQAQTAEFKKFSDNKARLATGQEPSNADRVQDVINGIMPSLNLGLKQAAAFAGKAKVLRDKGASANPPDVAEGITFYENTIQKIARDITQPAGNIVKHLKKNVPANELAFLVNRNGGGFHVNPATLVGFTQELGGLAVALKGIRTWYEANK